MKMKQIGRLAWLALALAGAESLAACDDGSAGTPSSSTSSSVGSGGAGGSSDVGGGGAGGSGGGAYQWPVETHPIEITPSPDWKNRISFPYDAFGAWGGGEMALSWVKFTVLMHDPSKVYYQDTTVFPFHGEFDTARLDPFFGMSLAEFDRVSLHEEGQEAILGAVLISPTPYDAPEVGIQLVRQEAYDPEMVRVVLDLVKKSIDAPDNLRTFYFPTYEQFDSAKENSASFEASGFPVSSVERWLKGDACYATGWAVGKLQYVPPEEIDAAYASGVLKPEDILLTDAIPAEVPYVAGIVSLSPSTPNAHTALLATSFGIPFVYVAGADSAQHAKDLVGKEIALRAYLKYGSVCTVALVDTDGKLSPADKAELIGLKRPADLGLRPKEPLGAYFGSTEDLGPADVVHFGGKAANYGLLRDAIPNNSDEAVALSFDLWDGFLDQAMSGGGTLRAEIAAKLGAYSYPPDLRQLKTDLAGIRERITKDTVFSAEQKMGVEAALAGFDPTKKIRFRSSTNVEDSDVFTGAGLYDSYSGCLADDKDADETGPSLCDPTQDDERGVYRAIRKVYASFYNDNAVLARLLYNVKESDVGMAVLVHPSYPDEDEMANGVATLSRGASGSDELIKLVTQIGATSVTNPEGGALPEVAYSFGLGSHVSMSSASTLVPLGAHVMTWEDDYLALVGLLVDVEQQFRQAHPEKTSFLLDYEYKKMKPGKLIVKQVREVSLPNTTPSLTPFLLGEPQELCTSQSELGNVFEKHRLKVRVNASTKSAFLTPAAVASTLFADASVAYTSGSSVKTVSGNPATWPAAAHGYADEIATDSFEEGDGAGRRTFSIVAEPVPALLPPSLGPLVLQSDLGVSFQADYATPVLVIDYDGTPATVSQERVYLASCPTEGDPPLGSTLQERSFTTASGVAVKTSFYWPPAPTGPTAGYTAPLYKWVETKLEGLTATPIVLKGYYAQTYQPHHHNFDEEFLFEPRLEEGIDPASVAELEAKGIRMVHVFAPTEPGRSPTLKTIDAAGVLTPLN